MPHTRCSLAAPSTTRAHPHSHLISQRAFLTFSPPPLSRAHSFERARSLSRAHTLSISLSRPLDLSLLNVSCRTHIQAASYHPRAPAPISTAQPGLNPSSNMVNMGILGNMRNMGGVGPGGGGVGVGGYAGQVYRSARS